MIVFVRHIRAVLVVIAMIAAQIMPAWAGCHSQRHVAAIFDTAVETEIAITVPGHHRMMDSADAVAGASDGTSEQTPTSKDVCLGNCGCACSLSGAFVLTGTIAIGALYGVVRNPEFVSSRLPLGDRPDGPRRPPRTAV